MNKKIGVVLSYVLIVMEAVSALFLTPIILQYLGDSEYGVYKLSASLNSYLLILDMGVGSSILRYISKYRATGDIEGCKKFFGISNVFFFIVSLVAIGVGVVLVLLYPRLFAQGLSNEECILGQKLLTIMAIDAAITLGFSAFSNVIVAFEKFTISRGLSISQVILRVVVTIGLLKCGMGSLELVLLTTILNFLCKLVYVFYVLFVIKLTPTLKAVDIRLIKETVAFSALILLQIIATQINNSVDQILIGALVKSSTTILSVYSVGMILSTYFQSIGSAFYSVLMPSTTRFVECYSNEAKKMTAEMVRISRLAFIILGLIWIGFLCLGKEFILLWVGVEKIDAYYVAVLLMSAMLFSYTELIGSQMLWALNKHKEQSLLKFIIVVINTVFTVFLIKWNPLFGSSIGTALSIFIGDVILMNILYSKKLGINLITYYKGLFNGTIFCILAAGIVGCILEWTLPSGWLWFMLKGVCVVCSYLVCLLLFGFSASEKELLAGIFRKLTKKGRGSIL